MIIRLGYVAITLNLKNVTSSSTVTFANYNKLKNEEEKLMKMEYMLNLSKIINSYEDVRGILTKYFEKQKKDENGIVK